MLRWIFTTIVVLLALLFWYMTLTVPMVVATTPGLIAIFLSVVATLTWPKRREKTALNKEVPH